MIIHTPETSTPINKIFLSVYETPGLDTLLSSLVQIVPEVKICSFGENLEVARQILGASLSRKHLIELPRISSRQVEHSRAVRDRKDRSSDLPVLELGSLEGFLAGPIEMVVANLPMKTAFEASAEAQRQAETAKEIIAGIDVGLISVIRAAAKNFEKVACVTDPRDYPLVITSLRLGNGAIDRQTRLRCARKAFDMTSDYDADIANFLRQVVTPEALKKFGFRVYGKRL